MLLCTIGVSVHCIPVKAQDSSLIWLAKHQEKDGHWDSVKYSASKKNDVTATSLALLAFLGAGYTEKVGAELKDNVKRGIDWLKQHQTDKGRIFDKTDATGDFEDGSAICFSTLALCEAAAMADVPETRAAAQKAVDFLTNTYPIRSTKNFEKKEFKMDAKADTVTASLCVFAMKSAKVAKLNVDSGAFDAATEYFDSVQYTAGKGLNSATYFRFKPKQQNSPEHSAQRLTAAGLVARQFMGWKRADLESGAANLVEEYGRPEWDKDDVKVDLLCWWITTLCLFQQGGETWSAWSEQLKRELISEQRRHNDPAGSWDPVGAPGKVWGRVGQTALAALSLEVYYRYRQLVPEK